MEVKPEHVLPIAIAVGIVGLVAAFAYWYFTREPKIEISDYEVY